MICVQNVVEKKKFLVKFEDEQNKDTSSFLLSYVCSKEEARLAMDAPISKLPEKEQGELLTIDGDPDFE